MGLSKNFLVEIGFKIQIGKNRKIERTKLNGKR